MTAEPCGQALLLQAEFDGELDAARAAALAEHRATCETCRANWAALEASRAAMKSEATYHRAPDSLRRAIAARVDPAPRAANVRRGPARWWREGASFVVGAALAASLVLVMRPASDDALLAAVVDDHVRALEPGHLTDVISTDQHTVKPWFDGKLDFAPPVKDLAGQGYPLIGGRLDYLGGHAVAALAYTHGKHPIELLVWPEGGAAQAPQAAVRNGYNVIHWRSNGMAFWAVSDLEADLLQAFVADWQKL